MILNYTRFMLQMGLYNIIISCSNTKFNHRYIDNEGKKIFFVDTISRRSPAKGNYLLDDIDTTDTASPQRSYRDIILTQPDNKGLVPAYDIYTNPIYKKCFNHIKNRAYIMGNLGYGLIKASFKIAMYDTLLKRAQNETKQKHEELYTKYSQLENSFMPLICFMGPVFYDTLNQHTLNYPGPIIVIHNKFKTPEKPHLNKFIFLYADIMTKTNWNYEVANNFLDNPIKNFDSFVQTMKDER